ncbi:transcriptional regulator [Candidatus Nanohalococcus occultus]|uniref:Transcriptional regulator fused phosphomethylpyrimidine kinase, involved in the thiamine biosynthesis n=1 Tax=Candidatus Nanohalococcus occultus TaxID=2978047 RepID=A0ABY8CF63_9ARCH|nr:Putative transcriptional regulator fused phosphomethylpyrimidine kinase, involved in the thiamine biosynthesis [Candidatus Nanohaloarchaeota archaeon SVXNc]
MKFEAEVISDELLPAVRSLLSSELKDSYGMTQRDIAQRLEITQPAVSQYLNDQRADQSVKNKLKDDPQIMILVNEAAGKLAVDKDPTGEVSDILRAVRDKGLLKEKFRDAAKL